MTTHPVPITETQESKKQDEPAHQANGEAVANEAATTGNADEHADQGSDEFDPMDYYLNPKHLIDHVQDTHYFEFPSLDLNDQHTNKLKLPFGLDEDNAAIRPVVAIPENQYVSSVYLRPTKFMVMELVAAVLIFVLFTYLARQIRNGDRPRGRLANLLETMVVFVRDDIARPSIGSKDAQRFLPFLFTIFFFILALNLFGMIPFMGTATGALGCTVALALITFSVVLWSGMKRLGVIGFWKAQVPHLDVPPVMKFTLVPMIWLIEVFGLFIKHMVLAVRLFANMFAGHLVLAVFIAFIGVTWNSFLVVGVLPASLGAAVMISLLELLVALIQAYVFALLAALFIGAAIHPH